MKLKLHTCVKCGGPRRSQTQEICSYCRGKPKDKCPRCGGLKGVKQSICIRCHAKDATLLRWSKPHSQQSRRDICPTCGGLKMKEANLCHKCWNREHLKKEPPETIKISKDGRFRIYIHGRGRILRAHLVMEASLGYHIPRGYQVHHINRITDDDRIENLAILTRAAHLVLHRNEVKPKLPSKEELSAAGKKGAASRWKGHIKKGLITP